MLLGTSRALQATRVGGDRDVRQRARRNALTESFVVRARILLDFLYPSENSRPDDVVADDFVQDGPCWLTNRPTKSDVLERVHNRAGKEIAHLTYGSDEADHPLPEYGEGWETSKPSMCSEAAHAFVLRARWSGSWS